MESRRKNNDILACNHPSTPLVDQRKRCQQVATAIDMPENHTKKDTNSLGHAISMYQKFSNTGGRHQFDTPNMSFSKVIWCVLLLAGAVLTIVSTYHVFQEFMSFNVVTKVIINSVPELPFPAVTICNQNRIHCGNLKIAIQNCQGDSECKNSTKLDTFCALYVYGKCESSVNAAEK